MKIGITEAGDGGLDLSWASKMDGIDAAVVITKNLTPGCQQALLQHADKCILHHTITGFGGTKVEPGVPPWLTSVKNLNALRKDGFPTRQVVVRVDPIIPSGKGIERAKTVFTAAAGFGFLRFRVSVIDMYPHVRERFQQAGLPLPYGSGFSPSKEMLDAVDAMLAEMKGIFPGLVIESCAERLKEANPVGCVSQNDLDILGIPSEPLDSSGRQRSGCLCCSAKTELLKHKTRCPHGCLYCYWKD